MLNNKNKRKKGIIVLKKPDPKACGGTSATLDTNAPKKISSDDMILFDVTSALGRVNTGQGYEGPGFLSAYAAKTKKGSFLCLSVSKGSWRGEERELIVKYVKDDIFPALARAVCDFDLAKNNGFHSKTHGLPEDFGGEVRIIYSSGERIDHSNNQTPVISREFALKVIGIFKDGMKGAIVDAPSANDIRKIRFVEERDDGGYTKAEIVFCKDGGGTVSIRSKYDGSDEYERNCEATSEMTDKIKEIMEKTHIVSWSDLPMREFVIGSVKRLEFEFDDQILSAPSDRDTPDEIDRGFFDIELIMTTAR